MNSKFSSPTQNKTYHYGSPSMKPSSPSAKNKLSHNTPSTQSNKDLSHQKEEFKDLKFLNTPSSFTPKNKISPNSPNKLDFSMKNPHHQYLEPKNMSIKGPMYASDSSLEGSSKYKLPAPEGVGKQSDEKQKKMARMSEAPYESMKASISDIRK